MKLLNKIAILGVIISTVSVCIVYHISEKIATSKLDEIQKQMDESIRDMK